MSDYSGANPYSLVGLIGALLHLLVLTFSLCADAVGGEYAEVFEGPDPDAIYLRLNAGEYRLEEPGGQYLHRQKDEILVRMAGYPVEDSPGNPALPYKIFHAALPPDADPATLSVEVVHVVEKELPAPIRITPAPPYVLGQAVTPERLEEWEFHKWGTGKKIRNGRNTLVYERDELFPRAHALVEPSGQLRKWKVLAVKFYPVRYNPVQKRAVLVTETTIRVHFERLQQMPPQMEALLRDTTMDERAKQLFLNYDRARWWYQKPLLEPEKQGLSSDAGKDGRAVVDPNFVIVTTDQTRRTDEDDPTTRKALADFCFHKQDLGYSVMIVTETNTYTVTGLPGEYRFLEEPDGYENVTDDDPPHQTPQKIRRWLQENWVERGIDYVLLMGDPDPDNIGEDDDHVGGIPMVQIWREITSDYPTDSYYADLSGNWNLDGDDYTGEMYPFEGFSTLPDGVTGVGSVRWSGLVHLAGINHPAGTKLFRFNGYRGGQARFQFDRENNDFDSTDDVFNLDEDADPHPEKFVEEPTDLEDGTYPVQIELRNISRDAYLKINLTGLFGVTAEFKHRDEGGALVDGLRAEYFDSSDLSGDSVISLIEPIPYIEHISGGDRGLDGVELYPEVTVGRIPLYDENNDGTPDVSILDEILHKIIAYENADVRAENWRRRVLCSTPTVFDFDRNNVPESADYMGCETLRSEIAPLPLWEWYRIHDEDFGVYAEITNGCSYDKTVQAWNDPEDPDNGRGVVMWRTHGLPTYADKVFDEDQCVELNDEKPSIVIHATCENGHPEVLQDDDGNPTYPLAYSLLKHGAIATIAATRSSPGGTFDVSRASISIKSNPYLMYFFAKGIFNNLRLGDVVAHVREFDTLLADWPRTVFSYNLYGDPTLSLFGARPKSNNDTILLLDGSGSMLSEGKWEAAKDAAVLFRDVAAALRYPAFQDRYNTIVFRCMGGSDETSLVPAGTGLKNISEPLTIPDLDEFEPEHSNFTPIGGGLEMAYDQFDEPEDEDGFYANRTVVLLSDGKHNCGVNPQDIEAPEDVTVYTVVLGDDSNEPGTLINIADATGGDFRITPSPREVEDFFVQILASTSWKLQNIPVNSSGSVSIDQSNAIFLAVWDDPAVNISFELDPPGHSPNVTPSGVPSDYPGMTCAYDEAVGNETHAFYSCDNIPSDLIGEWHFANITDGVAIVSLDDVLLKVVEDPRVLADFSFGDGDVVAGQPITLIARMTEDGRPLEGLTDVYSDLVRSPAVAVGTLMVEHGPGKAIPGAAGDVDRTPRAEYLLQSMKAAKIATLNRVGGARVQLLDDGKGIDERANDGVYTGVFPDTRYEGSYTFGFRASGKSRDGVAFDRSETLSEFVKFRPSAAASDIAFPSKAVSKEDKTVHATVRVTPKDTFGNHLGPFRGNLVRLWTNVGTIAPGVEDHFDGSYSFKVVHPLDAAPLISIAIGDVLVAERTPILVHEPQYWLWLVIVILILLAVAVVIFFVRRSF